MGELETLGWIALGAVLGGVATQAVRSRLLRSRRSQRLVVNLMRPHFAPAPLDQITISERRFPTRVRADLQRGIDGLFGDTATILHFCGVGNEYSHCGNVSLAECVTESDHNPAIAVPPQYEDVDVGEDEPVRCLKNGLWLARRDGHPFAVLVAPVLQYGISGPVTSTQFEIATHSTPDGNRLTREFFNQLEAAVLRADSYRGKILSLEQEENSYSGQAVGVAVHKLRTVEREHVILPVSTLDLLDRNVIQFVRNRRQLARFRQSTKKGLLFYGPPGTGKTHTVHYLTRALAGHTTLLVTAEQIGLLGEYMALARLLQPSIVVIEDVDLIGRERTRSTGRTEEVLLNKLLNEMDGLKEDAEILFILTTNRPEMLEAALASRPGRIDQAIEFPLPDESGREKLVRLYSEGIQVADHVIAEIVRRTDRVSAAFIKELMRRSVQFHLERNGSGSLDLRDVESALDEMLVSGGSLNLKLLGAAGRHEPAESTSA